MTPARGGRPPSFPDRIRVVDSHTEGEPTRVVVEGWPPLEGATMEERREEVRARWDHLRRAVVLEPRGHEALVGALLTPPVTPGAEAGVVFFNNVGCLGMCGHGLMGVVRTLEHLGRLGPGRARFDTPVGPIGAELSPAGHVTLRNGPARVHRDGIELDVPGLGRIRGTIAWGGNWFFLTRLDAPSLTLENARELEDLTRRILGAVQGAGLTGDDGGTIDHVELTAPPVAEGAHARNFVLCPGGVYDRSPCGTGTSALLAALHASGRLAPGERWVQESVTGGRFTGWLEEHGGRLHPMLRGRAWVTGEAVLRFDAADPFRGGFGPGRAAG